ncbi:hypothetical protein IGI65_002615 [Enterococcus sp. DIV0755b]|uniref:DsbA family protein n=1 Tax=Enterococcus sp. DIV0755b TaxID=2774657 RepID=UPI003F2140D8
MIEIYLFVNPLGAICLSSEKRLLNFVQTSEQKIQFRLMPLVNMQTITDVMKRYNIPKHDIEARNKLFENTYAAALDAKALQLQGKKKARKFLMQMQEEVACKKKEYTQELVLSLVEAVGGDLEMFEEDRRSDLVKTLFQEDQNTAREMGITTHPSAVVYNYACERDYGVLLEGEEALADIPRLCQVDKENYQIFHIDGYLQRKNERRISHDSKHLKLM